MKNFLSSWKIFLLFFIILVFARSLHLLGFPLYLDEGIYISWAKLISKDWSLAYISLNDGKTPLFMWIVAFLSGNFHSSFFAGRFLSVVAGGATGVIWAVITDITLGKKYMRWYMLLALIVPYAFFVERMAFVDSLLTALVSISLLFLLLTKNWIMKPNGKMAWVSFLLSFTSGLVLAAAYMTKTSAQLFLLAQLLIGVLWIGEFVWSHQKKKAFLFLVNLGVMTAVYREVIGYMHVGAARFWGGILSKEAELTYSPAGALTTALHHPEQYIDHALLTTQYMATYLGFILVLFFISLILLCKNRTLLKKAGWIFLYALIIGGGTVVAAKTLASRYLYPAVPPMLCLSSIALVWVFEKKRRWIQMLVISLLAVTALTSAWIVWKPESFPYAGNERQFTTGDVSALGLQEVVSLLKPEAGKSVVAVTGIWGVSDGSSVILQEAGIESFGIPEVLTQTKPGQWKLHIDQLENSKKPKKYLYITDAQTNIEVLEQFKGITLVRAFQRPSTLKTYLFRVE